MKETISNFSNAAHAKRAGDADAGTPDTKFRDVFESSPVGMALLDMDGMYVDANRAIVSLHGYHSKEELLGRPFTDMVCPQHRKWALEKWKETLEKGRNTKSITLDLCKRDGSTLSANVFGTLLRNKNGEQSVVLAMVDDVTDLKVAERRLRESEERARHVIKHAPSGICEVDLDTGRFIAVNDSMCDITGYSREELLKIGPPDLLDDTGKARYQHRMALVAKDKDDAREPAEYTIVRKDGEERFANVRRTIIYDDSHPVSLVAVINDITGRKVVEEEKNNFIAIMSHELRNPLSPIIAGAEIVRARIAQEKHGGAACEEVDEMMGIIEAQGRNMARLLDDLLDIARVSRGLIRLHMQRTDIVSVAKSAAQSVRPLMHERGHHFSTELLPMAIYLNADPVRLEQVMVNLLNNAAKYTEPGGKVLLRLKKKGDVVRVSVRDNGMGIEHNMIDALLDPSLKKIHSYRAAPGGLGIGLKITKELVELHGGTIAMRSEGAGKGSEMIVDLPLKVGGSARAAHSNVRGPALHMGRKRVLLVEDEKNLAELMAKGLNLVGVDTKVCHDGASALEEMRRCAPDAVLVDIGLPDMDGYEVARSVRALESDSRQRIMLIAVTGFGRDEDKERARQAGFDLHLTKPVSLGDLKSALS